MDDLESYFSLDLNPTPEQPYVKKKTAFDQYHENVQKNEIKIKQKKQQHHNARKDHIEKSYADKYIKQEENSIVMPDHLLKKVHGKQNKSAAKMKTKSKTLKMEDLSSEDEAWEKIASNKIDIGIRHNPHPCSHKYDPKLGIFSSRKEILHKIDTNQVVVIQGPTGCGKTTQVPQYIYDDCLEKNLFCNVMVTQPRRIAAISICDRICSERNWTVGSTCGYMVGMKNKTSHLTKITYCTTGVLLNRIVHEKNLDAFSHIIIDEVHERDINIDFCLILVRKLLRSVSPNVKVILMSATIESQLFSNYFTIPKPGFEKTLVNCPIISLKSHSFVVTEIYLDQIKSLKSMMPPIANIMNPVIEREMIVFATELIISFDDLDRDGCERGSVLIFLPGFREIMNMKKELEKYSHKKKLILLPLHSCISQVDQARVFAKPQRGCRKIIIATNIAESSITVPDIFYVVDFCLSKSLKTDEKTNFSSLSLEWASKANLIQRKGRAGRLNNGKVFRLVYQKFYDEMSEFGIPEIERCPLENLILKVKILDAGSPSAILALAINPPNMGSIKQSILHLKQVGAMEPLKDNQVCLEDDGNLTFVGRIIADLPLTIRLSKVVIYGYAFGMLEDCIVVAAAISSKSFMVNPLNSQLQAYTSKLAWSNNSQSDCLTHLNVYKTWSKLCESNILNDENSQNEWGRKNYVDIRVIKDVKMVVDDIRKRLVKFGIIGSSSNDEEEAIEPIYSDKGDASLMLKIIIAGAFYPNYMKKKLKTEIDLIRNMDCRNHQTTVMLKMSKIQCPEEYSVQIKDKFMSFSRFTPKVFFDNTKVYVEFIKDLDLESKFHPAVYQALKMRTPQGIQLINPKKYIPKKGRQNNYTCDSEITNKETNLKYFELPGHYNDIEIEISHYVSCHSFYIQMIGDEMSKLFNTISQISQQNMQNLSNVNVGDLCMAPYRTSEDEDIYYYRAKIMKQINATQVKIFFIDYGNTCIVENISLKVLERKYQEIPMMARLCQLVNCEISSLCVFDGLQQKALEHLRYFTQNKFCTIKVYSIINDECRVNLYAEGKLINKEMVNLNYLETAEESIKSQRDNRMREAYSDVTTMQLSEHIANMELQNKMPSNNNKEYSQIILKGPTSAYEAEFIGITSYARSRLLVVNQDSVNHIVLDERTDYEQVLVASHLMVTSKGLMAHTTTLLPPHTSILEIIAMIFSPSIELRCNSAKTHYTGVLCGLGWEDCIGTAYPALPESDMELTFANKIDQEDIYSINLIRQYINTILGGNLERIQFSLEEFGDIENQIRNCIRQLIQKKRDKIEIEHFKNSGEWKQIADEDILLGNESYLPGRIFNLHDAINLI